MHTMWSMINILCDIFDMLEFIKRFTDEDSSLVDCFASEFIISFTLLHPRWYNG
jgi:hypothetical protein